MPSRKHHHPRTTINSLPPEIITQIVDEATLLREREDITFQTLMQIGAQIGAQIGMDLPLPLDAMGGLLDAMGLRGLAQPPPPPPPPAPRQAPPPPPIPQPQPVPQTTRTPDPRPNPFAQFPFTAPTTTQPQPLGAMGTFFNFFNGRPIPPATTTVAPTPTAVPLPVSTSSAPVQIPPPVAVTASTSPPRASSSTFSFDFNLPPFAPAMPTTYNPNIVLPSSLIPPSSTSATTSIPPPPAANGGNASDSMPALVGDSSDPESDEGMPALISHHIPTTSVPTLTPILPPTLPPLGSKNPGFDQDYDTMPPLVQDSEDEDDDRLRTGRAAGPRPVVTATAENWDEMSPLEDIDESDGYEDDYGGEDEDDDDDDDEEEDDEDDDEDGSDDDEDKIFPDGLPVSPLLPLQFISRPFLHASRLRLYKSITLSSVWQASLLLRSLISPQHAARDSQEASEGHPGNYLPNLVRHLHLERAEETDLSLARGGAGVYIGILEVCGNLEELTMQMGFLKSSTKTFLAALSNLHRLKRVDIRSGTDLTRPFIVTTARLFKLVQVSWLVLEELSITGLKAACEGTSKEEDEMWDLEYQLEDGDENFNKADEESEKKKEKRPGLKAVRMIEPDVDFAEFQLIIKNSAKTLTALEIVSPSIALSRFGLASIILTFGTNLTELTLNIQSTWWPIPKSTNALTKPAFMIRPKTQKVGEPEETLLRAISLCPHFLDATVGHMPSLKMCKWDGPLASTAVFSAFPSSVTTVEFGHCPGVNPGSLAKILNKTFNRTRSVKNPDGSFSNRAVKTIACKGLNCMSVRHDDLNWGDRDIRALEIATSARDVCLHLSGGPNGMFGVGGGAGGGPPPGFFPFFGMGGPGGGGDDM